MYRLTRLLEISKKHLRLKCIECKKLLPYEHFKNKHTPPHRMVCVSCKKLCNSCGMCLPLSEFCLTKDNSYNSMDSNITSSTENSNVTQSINCSKESSHANNEEKCNICRRCAAKSVIAHENVYYRYPILKYRACPFSADAMREQITKERTLHETD